LNDTLKDEEKVLAFLKSNPKATQIDIAKQIGKSAITAKRITIVLQEKGLLVRKNGKRDGYWEVLK